MDYVSCTRSELETLEQKYNVDNLKSQKTNIQSQINIIYAELNAALVIVEGKPITMQSIYAEKQRLVRDANSKILPLQAQLDLVNSQLPTALDSVIRECKALGVAKINQLQQQSYASKLVQEQILKEDREKELKKILQTQCHVNSTLRDDGKCYCNTGYINSNLGSGCVTPIDWCKETNSNYNSETKQCYCPDGYDRLNDGSKCIPVTKEFCLIKFGETSINNGNACYCKDGYTLNNDRKSCVKNNDSETNEQTTLKTYISTKQRINIRKSPSSSTKILSITTPNKKYEMLSQNKDWVEVRLGKTNGWIMKKYVKFQ